MKLLFAILALMFSVQSAAQSAKPAEQVLARYAFAADHTDQGIEYAVLTYVQGGTLVVDRYLYTWQSGADGQLLSTDEVFLPRAVDARILGAVKSLANAEIEEHTADVVCMMMPMPAPNRDLQVRRGYDYNTDSFSFDVETVMTNKGCWDPYRAYPKQGFEADEARRLMQTLEIAALMGLGL